MNIGELIDHYQEWVDYDMKRYGKISDETNRDIEEAGLQIVKDKYGDYEVIARRYDESLEASKSRTFIELPEFQKLWQKFNLTDDDLMSLQNQIINGNQAVSLGSNVYKIRFSPKQISKGKNTTDRVIYIDYIIDSKVYLVTIFSKSDESNLTKDELNNIRKLSKSLEVK